MCKYIMHLYRKAHGVLYIVGQFPQMSLKQELQIHYASVYIDDGAPTEPSTSATLRSAEDGGSLAASARSFATWCGGEGGEREREQERERERESTHEQHELTGGRKAHGVLYIVGQFPQMSLKQELFFTLSLSLLLVSTTSIYY